MNKDRPLWAWAFFGVAVLLKQPAAAMMPVLLVLSYRRYGWRTAFDGLLVLAIMWLAVSLPFIMGSGLKDALTPYTAASDAFPYMTNNAFNIWYAAATLHKGAPLVVFEPGLSDAQLMFNVIKYKTVGLGLLMGYALLISAVMWKRPHARLEFVWATALFWDFFLLPTQDHERYLYPGAVLILIAVAQEPRLLWVGLVAIVTFTYNILAVVFPLNWPELTLGINYWAVPISILNIILLMAITYYVLTPHLSRDETVPKPLMATG